MNIFSNIKKVTYIRRDEIALIFVFAIISSFFYLIIPVAAQGLVTFVSFGRITQPLFILAFCVLVALISAASVNLMQIYLIENIQQRLFAHTTIAFSKNLPRVLIEIFDSYRGTELTNRYFDIFIVQKCVVELLLSGVIFLLQTILGMILIAFYHPYFLIFDFILLSGILMCVFLPWGKGFHTAIEESNAKYKLGGWLEEISRIPMLFKFSNNQKIGFKIADEKILEYLIQRQKHFKQIFTHAIGGYLIQTLSLTSILLLGGFLVIKNQLTLGQLVAAEVVVAAIGQGAQKLSKNIESFYDLAAASEKLTFLMNLPLEKSTRFKNSTLTNIIETPPLVTVENLGFKNEDGAIILKDIHFGIDPKNTLLIFSESGKGKTLLCRLLTGILEPSIGTITYNKVSIRDFDLEKLRSKICYISDVAFFDGNLFQNLVMSDEKISVQEVSDAIHLFKLEKVVAKLKNGLFTAINDNHYSISNNELLMMMFVRAYLAKPHFLIIDSTIDLLPKEVANFLIELIKKKVFDATIIITTSKKEMIDEFNNVMSL